MGVLVVGVLSSLVGIAALVRNSWVYRELMRVNAEVGRLVNLDIDEAYRLNVADIEAGRYDRLGERWAWSRWRRKAFDAGPCYDEMFFKFWRPVSSFHRDAPYLR